MPHWGSAGRAPRLTRAVCRIPGSLQEVAPPSVLQTARRCAAQAWDGVRMDADMVVVGGGLAGLVAAAEFADAGKQVLIVEQEPELIARAGERSCRSSSSLFFVDEPRAASAAASTIRLSSLAGLEGWLAAPAGVDREEQWGQVGAGVRRVRRRREARLAPRASSPFWRVGWAERGGCRASGTATRSRGSTWPGAPGPVVKPLAALRDAIGGRPGAHPRSATGSTSWSSAAARSRGPGRVLADETRQAVAAYNAGRRREFELRAQAHSSRRRHRRNHDLVRRPGRAVGARGSMISGVPAHVEAACSRSRRPGPPPRQPRPDVALTEGIGTGPIWPNHGIRILPGPSSMWFDALGRRLPAPRLPGSDTARDAAAVRRPGHRGLRLLVVHADAGIVEGVRPVGLRAEPRHRSGRSGARPAASSTRADRPVEANNQDGEDFVVAHRLEELVAGMHELHRPAALDAVTLAREIAARDGQLDNPFTRTRQIQGIRNARRYLGDRLVEPRRRTASSTPTDGPLIAVKLHVLTRRRSAASRRTSQVARSDADGSPCPASTRRARSPASAAAACTATTRSRARSSAAACSGDGQPAGRPPRRFDGAAHPDSSSRRAVAVASRGTHAHRALPHVPRDVGGDRGDRRGGRAGRRQRFLCARTAVP